MKDVTMNYDPADIQDAKGTAWLSYFGLFLLIPLLSKPNSRYIKHHCNIGLIIIIAGIISSVISAIPYVGLLALVINLVVFIVWIMGLIHTFQGKAYDFPLLDKIKIIK